MHSREDHRNRLARVAEQLSPVIRRQAHRKWDDVRMAERNERGRHVWRFRSGKGKTERFLHVSHDAMTDGENAAATLLQQLKESGWADRLHEGPETALILSRGGRLEPWTEA